MKQTANDLVAWIEHIATLIADDSDSGPQHYFSFLQDTSLCLKLIDLIDALSEGTAANSEADEEPPEDPLYEAHIYALEICLTQLQEAAEAGFKKATKTITEFMSYLATIMDKGQHSLVFWLPFLNTFYDAHLELSPELQDAYFNLASEEGASNGEMATEEEHLESIRHMIHELSELSVFDIADSFFAQSHAMPPEFFADFFVDLYSIEEGHEVALLMLMHPNFEVRAIIMETFNSLISTLTLSDTALTRLQCIKNCYPESYHKTSDNWIKIQRRKGVVFQKTSPLPIAHLTATEVDGSGSQVIFMHLKQGRKHQICSLLFKLGYGIKDIWITPYLSAKEVKKYYTNTEHDPVTLRKVDLDYLIQMTENFLAETIDCEAVPNLHFLEIQELLGYHFLAKEIDVDAMMENLAIQITPFTEDNIQHSFKRSKSWLKNKSFTESWYVENSNVDKLVNRCSSFVDGIKVCAIEDATTLVFAEEMELQRDRLFFHFLWISLWLKASATKTDSSWQDSFIIAYCIYHQRPLDTIPVLQEIVYQTILNSIETMTERRTHLNQE